MAGLNMDSVWVRCFLMQPVIAKLPVPQSCQTQQEIAAWNLENWLLTLLRNPGSLEDNGKKWWVIVGKSLLHPSEQQHTSSLIWSPGKPTGSHIKIQLMPFMRLHQKCVKSASAWKEHRSSDMRHSVHRTTAGVCFSSAHNLQNARLSRKKGGAKQLMPVEFHIL